MLQPINLGDPNFYGGRIRQLYDNLINHGHREREGAAPGDPLPFSYAEFESKVNGALAVGFCHHCGGPLNKSNCSPDHKHALSVGGTSELSNIRIICKDCNKKKGHMLDDEFHRKMFSTRFANRRMASAGRSLPDPCADLPSPSHTGDVGRAARGIASVRLNATQMRSCVEMWSKPSGFPKVQAIGRIIQQAFDGELTIIQALAEMAKVTGEYAALKLRLEKATQASSPNGATKSTA